ncbi:hypothetical protein [Neorhodopirellula pilleata]|uniref:hypothetical protein n=1 Tax=Neorhodopirellula pilleata TaxID=2714738 RepID=UPI001E362795|nr:hypothetical protein [Neorhodopirellula pilleata]
MTLALFALASLAFGSASYAQGPGLYGFQPFGFYQPYGIQYRSSVATPPYFSVNPPVYYGTRHYRPYGISPFAAPPQVTAPAGYHGQPGASGVRSRHYSGPVGNPFICRSDSVPSASTSSDETVSNASNGGQTQQVANAFTPGKVQTNPFVATEVQLAQANLIGSQK